ncbi:hypothetical protein [Nonomuraea fuscirosea]|uniref:hypothetical protein n=1 Tax=Nonomuraea fuscirosea TaxID=1291556 RepID=UPI0033E6FEE4
MTNNGASSYGDLGNLRMPGMGQGVSFQKGELDRAGGKIDGHVEYFSSLSEKADALRVPSPHFSVLGMGVQSAHEKAIQNQRDVLKRAHDSLASWKSALKAADENYKAADDGSGNQYPPGGPGGKFPGGINPAGLKPGGLNPGDLPNGGGLDLPKPPGSDLPGGDIPGPPGGDLPGGNLPGGDLPGSDLPGGNTPGGPGSNLPGTDIPQPEVPKTDPADMKVPDIGAALNDPSKTDLSQFQPQNPSLTGNLPPGTDPSALGNRTAVPNTYGGPGGGVSAGTGGGLGANGLPGGGAAGLRGAGPAGGAPMMPMMPMSGGAGGQEGRDREKTIGLSEDEGLWMGDEDIAPQVIGQEEV